MNDKDKILEFLMKNKSSTPNQRELKKELFPELNKDQVKELLDQIIAYKSNLIKVYKEYKSGLMPVAYSGLIDEFLNSGGFTKIEANSLVKLETLSKKEDLENQILNLKRDNLRLKNWDIRFRWLIALGTFISGFILKYLIDKV